MKSDYMTQKREKLVDLLTEGYFEKDEAKCLLYIADNEDIESKEIEYKLLLRQPEVSVALQELSDKDIIEVGEENKEGRGRPVKIYNLKRPIDEIINDVVEDIEENIKELKNKKKELQELSQDLL
ncbi:MAG: ArsR family transcriptional regulator [Candidatus Saliniplasma sp.]